MSKSTEQQEPSKKEKLKEFAANHWLWIIAAVIGTSASAAVAVGIRTYLRKKHYESNEKLKQLADQPIQEPGELKNKILAILLAETESRGTEEEKFAAIRKKLITLIDSYSTETGIDFAALYTEIVATGELLTQHLDEIKAATPAINDNQLEHFRNKTLGRNLAWVRDTLDTVVVTHLQEAIRAYIAERYRIIRIEETRYDDFPFIAEIPPEENTEYFVIEEKSGRKFVGFVRIVSDKPPEKTATTIFERGKQKLQKKPHPTQLTVTHLHNFSNNNETTAAGLFGVIDRALQTEASTVYVHFLIDDHNTHPQTPIITKEMMQGMFPWAQLVTGETATHNQVWEIHNPALGKETVQAIKKNPIK